MAVERSAVWVEKKGGTARELTPVPLFGTGVFCSEIGWTDDDILTDPAGRTHDDEAAIARLWQALSDYHIELDPRLPTPTPGAAERYAERMIERRDDPYTRTFVAEVDGKVVGYILGAVLDLHPDLFQHVEAGFIADIFVDPAYRQQGIARQLVDTMTEWFAERRRRACGMAGRRRQRIRHPILGSHRRQSHDDPHAQNVGRLR